MSFVSYTPEQECVLCMHSDKMRRALTTLYRHLQDGIEWPDAVFKVTQEFNVVSDQLEALFDAIEQA